MEEIQALAKLRSASRGTSLVTLLITPGTALSLPREQVQQELATSKNIKSKNVRKDVADALKSCGQLLHSRHPDVAPGNGLVLCCGHTKESYD